MEKGNGEARAAFYIADGTTLHHVTGMPEAYARYVDGFVIGPQSLACGLAASTGQPIIARPMSPENRCGNRGCGSPSSLTIVPVGRFQLRLRREKSSALSRCISRSRAMQLKTNSILQR